MHPTSRGPMDKLALTLGRIRSGIASGMRARGASAASTAGLPFPPEASGFSIKPGTGEHQLMRGMAAGMSGVFPKKGPRSLIGGQEATRKFWKSQPRAKPMSQEFTEKVLNPTVESITRVASEGESLMHPLVQNLLGGFESELLKQAAAPAQAAAQAAAPAAKTLAAKIIGVMRKKPLLTAATAAAAGAGAATGAAQAKAKKEEEERRREQVRQLLMQRLSEGGYVTG